MLIEVDDNSTGIAHHKLLLATSNCVNADILPMVVGSVPVRLVLARRTLQAFLRLVKPVGSVPPNALLFNDSVVSSVNDPIEAGRGPDILLPTVHSY